MKINFSFDAFAVVLSLVLLDLATLPFTQESGACGTATATPRPAPAAPRALAATPKATRPRRLLAAAYPQYRATVATQPR